MPRLHPLSGRSRHGHDGQDGHAHHHHLHADLGDRRISAAISVNLLLTVVQIVAGVLSGSLALVADAIHNLSDALSLVIAFAARRIARRPADAVMTYGYGRAEVLAAFVNYITLIVIALYLAVEGVGRLFDPPQVAGWVVVVVAVIALVVDLATAGLIWRLSRTSMNLRAAFLHNVMDALGSVAVIVSGTAILLWDWRLADPLVTLGISGYILWHAGREILPAARILMLGSPPGTEAEAVLEALRRVPGVAEIHHLHLWQMTEAETSVQAHVVLAESYSAANVRAALKAGLRRDFGIGHAVLELETEADRCVNPQVIGHPRPDHC